MAYRFDMHGEDEYIEEKGKSGRKLKKERIDAEMEDGAKKKRKRKKKKKKNSGFENDIDSSINR